ncbi:hypothetical protein IJ384_05165 [bacterium]|nr:hypothetical protein [bacterium]
MNISPINNNQPNFQAKISHSFWDAAENYMLGATEKRSVNYGQFARAVEKFGKYGNDETTIVFKKEIVDGTKRFSLYAEELGKNPVLLATKDSFRKLLQKFTHISEYEYNLKMNIK